MSVRDHGFVVVAVTDVTLAQPPRPVTPCIEWRTWLNDLPLLPPSEQLLAEEEAAFMLDNYLLPQQNGTDVGEQKTYLDIWLEGSRHDLSSEARQKRSDYIAQLEAAACKEVRLLAEPLKEQRRRMCERERMDELASAWWQQRLLQDDVQRLLREAWFAEVRTDGKYDGHWTDKFIEALMASEYGEGIARQWAVSGARNKRDQIKGYVVGLLKDAGVLKGSYDGIARLADPSDKKRRLSHYMSEGKQQLYAEWVKGYVEREQED